MPAFRLASQPGKASVWYDDTTPRNSSPAGGIIVHIKTIVHIKIRRVCHG